MPWSGPWQGRRDRLVPGHYICTAYFDPPVLVTP